MTQRILPFLITLFFSISIVAQPIRSKLPFQINVPNYNHFAPSISADGSTLIFASDYYVTDGNKVDLKISRNKGGGDNWGSGEEVTSINKSGEMNLHGAHCLSADGNTIYFTTKKTGGVGGFDIWMCEKKGNAWATPQNLGKPINSEGSDGYPSLSLDGKYLYFVRCQTMSNQGCEDCKLLVSEQKGQGFFKEPIPVSSVSNKSVIAPRIAKDGQTLTFASKTMGGKGGYDLFMTRKMGNTWSEPKNMEFLNTKDDEKYADFISPGDVMFYASRTNDYLNLYKARIPAEFQTSKIMMFTGNVLNAYKQAINGFLQVTDNQSGELVSMTKINTDGKFTTVLGADKIYDIAITSSTNNFFWSNTIDTRKLNVSKKEEIEAIVPSFTKNVILHGFKPIFDSTSFQTLSGANLEFKRIGRIISTQPNLKFEFVIYPSGISNNPPIDMEAAFQKMKSTFTEELLKAGIKGDKISISNGANTTEESENYSGWGIKMLP
jgi:OOP family OmpA-OmpF porin